MRRAAALVAIPLLAAAAVAGCGSSSSSKPADTATASGAVSVTGTFDKAPTVKIPAAAPTGSLVTKTLIEGTGAKLTSTESLLGNFVMYDWSGKTNKLIGSTYSEGIPTLFSGELLPGLEKALVGQKVGSRVLAVIPPSDGFGTAGNTSIGVAASDTVVFVVDMDQVYPNTAGVTGKQTSNAGGALPTVTAGAAGKGPTITIPKSGKAAAAAPKSLQVKNLVQGSGATVKKGQLVVVQYTGVNWRTGQVFDSSWTRGAPYGVVIGEGQVIPGWDTGLVGQKVGSRVLLVIPPADGYGTAGQSSAGISGTDTLVFTVDIIAASGG